MHNFSTELHAAGARATRMLRAMLLASRVLVPCLLLTAAAPAGADTTATLLRLFLADGGELVSFGEYARLDDRVVFSIPAGGTPDQPRLLVISLPVAAIDWSRTERYAASARYQWYAETRGEADFERLSGEVARVLNEIAISTDRRRALEIAEQARRTLSDWPSRHFGYRRSDVNEIVALLDEAISNLRASLGVTEFQLDFVAAGDVPALEPVRGMPPPADQLNHLLHAARLTDKPRERVVLLQAALTMIDDPVAGLANAATTKLRGSIEKAIREEHAIDGRYADLSRRLMRDATRAAEDARIDRVERLVERLPIEDARLGRRRPQEVQALRASLQSRLEDARRLRLLRDRWTIRRGLYRDWQRSAGSQLLQLVKLEPVLTSIKRLDGPEPDILASTRRRLLGGADRLERIGFSVAADFKPANDLLVSAWRFAEAAVASRFAAAAVGSLDRAREASSAAAAALLLLDRTQQEIRSLIEPPALQ